MGGTLAVADILTRVFMRDVIVNID
ncbi:uncharacterized protein METZ01_LOCUS8738 [marine metagenome]|uniref:Uncharacterized protein n=1 Tax=marine metagenome TaxID=408172 RepID=A0A381NP27_9ZZZZ